MQDQHYEQYIRNNIIVFFRSCTVMPGRCFDWRARFRPQLAVYFTVSGIVYDWHLVSGTPARSTNPLAISSFLWLCTLLISGLIKHESCDLRSH